jgi:hypothetical protein
LGGFFPEITDSYREVVLVEVFDQDWVSFKVGIQVGETRGDITHLEAIDEFLDCCGRDDLSNLGMLHPVIPGDRAE